MENDCFSALVVIPKKNKIKNKQTNKKKKKKKNDAFCIYNYSCLEASKTWKFLTENC